jgi:hypothetical protein
MTPEQAAALDAIEIENRELVLAGGLVRAVPPKDRATDPYWRIEYYQYGKRRQPSGGTTRDSAIRKANLALARLGSDTEAGRAQQQVGPVLDIWLHPETTHRRGKLWSGGTAAGHRPYVDNFMRPVLARMRFEQLERQHYRACVDRASTAKDGIQVRTRLSAFINWAHARGYVDSRQVLALKNIEWTAPARNRVALRPDRAERWSVSGEEESYLPPELVMSPDELTSIGEALASTYKPPKWMLRVAIQNNLEDLRVIT